MSDGRPDLRSLCAAIAIERDRNKLFDLVKQLLALLEEQPQSDTSFIRQGEARDLLGKDENL